MLVREIMTPGAETIGPTETLQEAARRMRIHDIGALVVREADGRLAGMITDRLSVGDLALVDRLLAAGVVEHAREPGRPSSWLALATPP